MHTEASERTLLPAPADTLLWPVGPDGHLGNSSTVVAFVVDPNHQIVDVVTNTGDKLRTPHGQPGALMIGDRVSFGGREYAWGDFFVAMSAREQKATIARRHVPSDPCGNSISNSQLKKEAKT